MKRVLLLGDQRSLAQFESGEWEIVTDADADGLFDAIVLDHILQQTDRASVLKIVDYYRDKLIDYGQLHIVVPSLEWACREIAKNDEPNPMAYLAIYGTDQEPHKCGMTLLWMRLVTEQAGLVPFRATKEGYLALLKIGEAEQEFQAEQNVLVAVKQPESAADAIS